MSSDGARGLLSSGAGLVLDFFELIVRRAPDHEMGAKLDIELFARPAAQQAIAADHGALRIARNFELAAERRGRFEPDFL
jgi:hypothetical protein